MTASAANPVRIIDLRSDTVTLPSPEMRRAMAEAELGDDVYGEDPTVNRLQRIAASMMGKEAALFVASGTMGNLIAMLVHCQRGGKAIIGAKSHSYVYEAGGASALGGVVLAPITNREDGGLDLDELREQLLTSGDSHFAQPAMVGIENTQNRCGGTAVPLSHMAEVSLLAKRRGLPVHLDGARVFNAAVALETGADKVAAQADTVSFCLSKGLACPVGSLLCGSHDFIAKAHRMRKMLGGGMRQAGVLAAAGIIALEKMVVRLADDHQNARALADGLATIDGVSVKSAPHRTNMVFFEAGSDPGRGRAFQTAMKDRGFLLGMLTPTMFRAVTHYGIERADIDSAVSAAREVAAQVIG